MQRNRLPVGMLPVDRKHDVVGVFEAQVVRQFVGMIAVVIEVFGQQAFVEQVKLFDQCQHFGFFKPVGQMGAVVERRHFVDGERCQGALDVVGINGTVGDAQGFGLQIANHLRDAQIGISHLVDEINVVVGPEKFFLHTFMLHEGHHFVHHIDAWREPGAWHFDEVGFFRQPFWFVAHDPDSETAFVVGMDASQGIFEFLPLSQVLNVRKNDVDGLIHFLTD